MSSITKQTVGDKTYLYESTSFRDKQGRPRNFKVSIGKIDKETGKPIYKEEFISRMKHAKTPIQGEYGIVEKKESKAKSPSDSRYFIQKILTEQKSFGIMYFLYHLAVQIGLIDILKETFSKTWSEIYTLACFLLSSDKSVMYCDDWIELNPAFSVGSMSSQRISELYSSITIKSKQDFFKSWYEKISDKEYIALDITSISTYSTGIKDAEFGYNRDHEKLPQINLCMLFGENTKLPVYQTLCSGSLKDVSTLKTTLIEISSITGGNNFILITDKGFYSTSNIDWLLTNNKFNFLLSVPFTNSFARKLVAQEKDTIDTLSNFIKTNDSDAPVRGIHRIIQIGTNKNKVHAHILFNPTKALKEREKLYQYVNELQSLAEKDPDNKKAKVDFKHYLIIEKYKGRKKGALVTIKKQVLDDELETIGWLVLLSNTVENPQLAIDRYRMKDVVEKSFWKYKNNLNLNRLRVHNDTRASNKMFIGFIALILSSYIHRIMKEKSLYKKMTFDRLFLILSKLKIFKTDSTEIIRPLTKEQKEIFENFNIEEPLENTAANFWETNILDE
jgi:transposase